MKKSDLVAWLLAETRQWDAFLVQIGPARLEQPGVNGAWSVKDIVAHLTGWQRNVVAQMRAASRNEPEPPTPWPAQLPSEDEINAWIYESNRNRSAREVLDDMHQVLEQLLAVIESLPDDVRIEIITTPVRDFYVVWLGDKRFPPGEFFYHFHDDHEPDIHAWLAREEKQ